MAKRGRKKKSKVTQLSTADKNHLKRIMAKVRQIKQNKKAAGGNGSAPDLASLQAAQRNLTQQLTSLSGNPANPSFQTQFNLISGQLLAINAQIAQALATTRR